MSGGSFDYLFCKDNPSAHAGDVERMADAIREYEVQAGRSFPKAHAATRALVAPELPHDDPLREVWRAIEWAHSGDTIDDDAIAALRKYEEDEAPPDLSGRRSRCAYRAGGCRHEADSDPDRLAFFEHLPDQGHDRHYCGCRGWD